MSRAFVINTKWLSNRVNKAREYLKPKHAVNKLFGATGLYLQYSQGFDRLSLASLEVGQSPSLNAPLPPSVPMSMKYPDALPAIEAKPIEIEKTANTDVVFDTCGNLIPTLMDYRGQIEYVDQKKNSNELEDLLNSLDETGLKVSEVEKLSAGVTRISVEDLIGTRNAKEPELVRVRG